tara:strand:+ start:321 stop:617 length:297 start_codon:yes stop_codon:yes gene_type:complete
MKWKEVIKKKELPKDFVPSGNFREDAKRLGIAVRPEPLTEDEIQQYVRHVMGESKTPQERVSTTPSTGQDEEAAKRTKENEAELLARIKERNKKSRQE